jgi:hypothetical protein
MTAGLTASKRALPTNLSLTYTLVVFGSATTFNEAGPVGSGAPPQADTLKAAVKNRKNNMRLKGE